MHMRIAFLTCSLLLCVAVSFAASRLPQSTVGSVDSKPPKELYSKGKGTVGLVAALVLGPVGWLGVRLLSRNKTQRKKASQGFMIWGEVVLITGLVWLMVLGAKSGNGLNLNFGGGGGGSGSKKKPASEATPQPPTYILQPSSPRAIKPL